MALDLPSTFDDARPLLTARAVGGVPLGLRAQRLALDGAVSAVDATVPVAADVRIGAILDLPQADVPVTDGMLRDWGVSLEDVLSTAVAGRAAVAPTVQQIDGAHLVSSMPFAAYALREPDAVAGLVAGRTPVILVPVVGAVVVAAAEDPAGLAVAARIAERVLQSDEHAVSVTPLVRSGSSWVPFTWPAEAAEEAAALRRRWDVQQYAVQRPLLQAHYDRTEQQYLVAEAALAGTPEGGTTTYTTLTEGVQTVLPWVEQVVLVRETGAATRVPMPRLAEASGILVRLPDLDPPLLYAARFPVELASG